MSLGNVEERIKKMKEAIKAEAQQRAQNMEQMSKEEASIQRMKMINHEKEKIDHEYYLKAKAEAVRAKIEKSSHVNRERLRKMKERFELVEQLKVEVSKELSKHIQNEKFHKELLSKLMVQSMLRLMERNVYIRAKAEQIPIMKAVIPESQKLFTQILKVSGKQMQSFLDISEHRLQDSQRNLIGGFYLTSSDGKIVCDNTLDSRVKLAFETMLPTIRKQLFSHSE